MLFIRNVTFMTDDPHRLADFWAAALGLSERVDKATETICAAADWRYPRLTFQRVADSATRRRRLHLDLTADDRRRGVQGRGLRGAHEQQDFSETDGWTWRVMPDPDGNEFCVPDPWVATQRWGCAVPAATTSGIERA